MKIIKMILSVIIAFAMTISVMPFEVFADIDSDTSERSDISGYSDQLYGKVNFAAGKTYKKSLTPSTDGSYMDAIRIDTDDAELTDGVLPRPDYWGEYGWVHWIGATPEITIDLQEKQVFDTFEVVALSHFSADGFILPTNVKISVSADNAVFREVATVDFPDSSVVTSATSYELSYTHTSKVSGRYVKFSFPAGWNLIGELRVFGIEGDEAPEEEPMDEIVSFGKKYSKSTPATLTGDYMDAVRADTDDKELTDGNTATPDYWGDAGWVHWIGPSVDIIVDLEKPQIFNQLEITALSHFSADGFILPTDVTISVSDDNSSWTQITKETFPDSSVVTTATAYTLCYKHPEALRGRYIKYSLPAGWNLISEIKAIKTADCPEFISPDMETNLASNEKYKLYANDAEPLYPDANYKLTNGIIDDAFVSWERNEKDLYVTAEFDFDFAKSVKEITVFTVSEFTSEMGLPSNIKIDVSSSTNPDKIEWVNVCDKQVLGADDLVCDMPDEAIVARFVRIILTQNSKYMPLVEIEVTGKGSTEGATDPSDYFAKSLIKISDGMEYTVSGADNYSDDENKLTDGKYADSSDDSAWNEFTLKYPSAGIEFDFGEIRYLHSIMVNAKADSLPVKMHISVSEDGENWTAVLTEKNVSGFGASHKYRYFSVTPVKAQYVMVYMQGAENSVFIDEIEILSNEKSEPSVVVPDVPTEPSNPLLKEGYAVPEDGIRSVALIDSDLQWNDEVLTEYATIFDAFCITGSNKKSMENKGFAIISEDVLENVSDNLDKARAENLGVYIEMNGDYKDTLDTLVEEKAQGRYVFKVIKVIPEISDYEYECTAKLIGGTLKKTSDEVAVTPVVEVVTSNWIGFAEVNGYEYSVDGESFTVDPVFTNLSADTDYTLYQRIRGTATKEPSEKAILEIKTAKAPEESSSEGDMGGGSSGGGGGGGSAHGGITQNYKPTEKPTVDGWVDGMYFENNKAVSGYKEIDSDAYYFNTLGVPQKGWIKANGGWYYANAEGILQTGWVKVNNVWYYFKSNAVMQTGWLKDDGEWYYLHSHGGMASSEWVEVKGSWYYFKGNGAMATGWLEQGGNWYYLNADGDMKTGWLNDGGNWYYLKPNGAMAIGWNWVGNSCYYFYGSGKMASATIVDGYKLSSSGAMIQ